MPGTSCTKLLSCAGDGQIRLCDVERHSTHYSKRPAPWLRQTWWDEDTRGTRVADFELDMVASVPAADAPHLVDSRGSMALKLVFLPDSPLSVLSTGRDKHVLLYDLREAAGKKRMVVDLSQHGPATDCVFDPVRPHVFALGCEDPYVRLYDIRHCGRKKCGGECHSPGSQVREEQR